MNTLGTSGTGILRTILKAHTYTHKKGVSPLFSEMKEMPVPPVPPLTGIEGGTP